MLVCGWSLLLLCVCCVVCCWGYVLFGLFGISYVMRLYAMLCGALCCLFVVCLGFVRCYCVWCVMWCGLASVLLCCVVGLLCVVVCVVLLMCSVLM